MTPIDQLSKCVEKCVSKSRNNDKTKISYWKRRIFRPTYFRDGVKFTSPNFSVEIQHTDRTLEPPVTKRVRWSLGPANPEVAAAKARDLFLYLVSNGWPATLAKFRPEKAPSADPTVGEFIQAVQKTADLEPRTLRSYIAALQKIVADISGLAADESKFGYGKAHKAWLAKLHSVRLSVLTPAAIQTWKRDFLSKAGQDPVSQRSARVSVNSFMRCARSLFSPKVIEHLDGLEMPSPLPFVGCQFEPRPNTKYRSTFDIAELVRSATEELALHDVEVYKVFLLASMVGLRRKEIDLLEWTSFRWDEGTIRIETTEHFSAKSEDSLGDVAVEPQVMELFRGWRASASGPFVIESLQAPRPGVTYDFYRADEVFGRLIYWLRSKGINSLKPLHVLRKEFGSEVCKHAGIYAASRALRHSDIKITCQYYVQDRTRAVVGLGHLLESPKVVEVEFRQEVA